MIINFLLNLKAQGLSQKAIAQKAGIGENMICRFLQGKTCTIETLVKFANAFHVSTDEVLGRTGIRSGENHYKGEERRHHTDNHTPGQA